MYLVQTQPVEGSILRHGLDSSCASRGCYLEEDRVDLPQHVDLQAHQRRLQRLPAIGQEPVRRVSHAPGAGVAGRRIRSVGLRQEIHEIHAGEELGQELPDHVRRQPQSPQLQRRVRQVPDVGRGQEFFALPLDLVLQILGPDPRQKPLQFQERLDDLVRHPLLEPQQRLVVFLLLLLEDVAVQILSVPQETHRHRRGDPPGADVVHDVADLLEVRITLHGFDIDGPEEVRDRRVRLV